MAPVAATATAKQRKKWTEEEERCLLRRYSDLQSDGSLSRLRTREKKFTPIADHVNSAHHRSDPAQYPHLWSWKDASTKVQNMRHQYLLVKQKVISAIQSHSTEGPDSSTHDCSAGVSLWPNFLLYREVFGDAPLPEKPLEPPPPEEDGELGLGFEEENGFDYEEESEEAEEAKKRRKGKKWRRREEEEWEERMERRREEWRQRVEGMLAHHRSQMADIQARVVSEQQSAVSQLLGIVSHWAGGGTGSQSFVAPAENGVAVPTGEDHQFIVEDGG